MINSANGEPVNLPDDMMEMYKNDIDMEKLKLHLQLLPDAIKLVNLNEVPIKEVTRISTICDVFNAQPILKSFITEVYKVLKLYLTIPVTTASAERNFSALKRVKTYLRNSMTQSWLNHCMLLHIHKELTENLSLPDIAE